MIRALRDEDVPGLVQVLRAVHVDFVTSERVVRHNLEANRDDARRGYWVAEVEGAVVGRSRSSFETFSSTPDVGRLNVSVLPELRRRGLGGELYAVAERFLVREGARRIEATAEDPAGSPFLERRGFRHTHTHEVSALTPTPVAVPEPPEGLRLVPLADVRDRPRDVFALHVEALRDVPGDTPLDAVDYGDWERNDWSFPELSDDGSFLLLDGGRPVALTLLVVDPAGGRATTAFTGTARSHRGRGLARLVKLASVAWAAEHGIDRMLTGNDATNAAMLAVNRRLGYVPVTEHRSYVKEL